MSGLFSKPKHLNQNNMQHLIVDKEDAIDHINNLFPIGQSIEWDEIWLNEIQSFGIENLPKELLARMVRLMIEDQGDSVIIDLE